MDPEKKRLLEIKNSGINLNPTIGLLEEVVLASAQKTNEPVTNSYDVTPEVDVDYRVLVNPSSEHL